MGPLSHLTCFEDKNYVVNPLVKKYVKSWDPATQKVNTEYYQVVQIKECNTSQMTQGARRLYSEVEVKAKAEVKIVVRS